MLQNGATLRGKSYQFSYRRGRLHERGHAGKDLVGGRDNNSFRRFPDAQHVVQVGVAIDVESGNILTMSSNAASKCQADERSTPRAHRRLRISGCWW